MASHDSQMVTPSKGSDGRAVHSAKKSKGIVHSYIEDTHISPRRPVASAQWLN
jgi:hypothetical protein